MRKVDLVAIFLRCEFRQQPLARVDPEASATDALLVQGPHMATAFDLPIDPIIRRVIGDIQDLFRPVLLQRFTCACVLFCEIWEVTGPLHNRSYARH